MMQTSHSPFPAAASDRAELPQVNFLDISVEALDSAEPEWLDMLSFGVVGIDQAGLTARYNALEANLAGLAQDAVLGREFFLTTGICMNNFLVAQRFEDEPVLDVTLDYVLTFRMRPTPVKLRLLQNPKCRLRYVLIQR
jgi:photoactive yellow protein